jgi:predicted ATPase
MLRDWLPKLGGVDALLAATEEQKRSDAQTKVRVAYQTREEVEYGGVREQRTGRTFEEAFALRNLTWSQAHEQESLGLKVAGDSLKEVADAMFGVVRTDFDKTAFAVGLLTIPEDTWSTPTYIEEGLRWLSKVLAPAAPKGGQ